MIPAPKMILAAVVLWNLAGLAHAQTPPIGTVQKLKAITFSLQVGNTDKETKRVTYTPPPGWYVRTHWVEVAARQGNVSYSVSTIPPQWSYSADERVDESTRLALDAALQAREVGAQAKAKQHRAYKVAGQQSVRSTHHALVLDVVAKGEGYFKGGAAVDLTVNAELIYLGHDPTRPAPLDVGTAQLGDPIAP